MLGYKQISISGPTYTV